MSELAADCARCLGLCCVAPAFARSADFPEDKPAGVPCRHLGDDARCRIHDHLRREGYLGCGVFDCFGAGQQATNHTFAGVDWRRTPERAAEVFAGFHVLRALHELRWYVAAALALPASDPLRPALEALAQTLRDHAAGSSTALAALDLGAVRGAVNVVLSEVSARARGPGAELRGADRSGKDLRRVDLRGANLRGARLIGADLRGVDLGRADLTGADLRGADLRGADCTGALFLHSAQLAAARGDVHTKVAPTHRRPSHWS